MNPNTTIDEFKSITEASQSMRDASIKLNIPFSTFKRIAKKLNVYKTNQNGKGIQKNIEGSKDILDNILSGLHNPYITTYDLKNRLLKFGYIDNKCTECGLSNTWNNKSLTLQLDHIDGNTRNNKKDNIRLLCPNCHSQTETYTGKNKVLKNKANYNELKSIVEEQCPSTIAELCKMIGITASKPNYIKVNKELITQNIDTTLQLKCLNCGVNITSTGKSGYCNKCVHILQHKTEHPHKQKLIEELKESNPYALGKKYGVSDNAIRKWMKKYNIPTKKADLLLYLQSIN